MQSIILKVISEIVKMGSTAAWHRCTREKKVLDILKTIGLKPGKPLPDFDHVYAYTLAEFGVEKPEPVLELFAHELIRQAFRKSFEKNDPAILHMEAEALIKWNKIGDDLREKNIENPRLEFARFTFLFNKMIDRTRTPLEVRMDNKIEEIRKSVKHIENLGLSDIRKENLKEIQGTLTDQLRAWFKTLGYSFGDHSIQSEEYDEWIIKIPARRGFDSILVRCMQGRAEQRHIDSLRESVSRKKTDEGWLITARRKAQSLCDPANGKDCVYCYTFDELLDQHADFSRYFNWLEQEVQKRGIDRMYIPLACTRDIIDPDTKEKTGQDNYGADNGWIEGYVDCWLSDPCKEHISILGEFGTGKTWFALHYAHTAMKKYLEAKELGLPRPRLPLVIQLRDYAKMLKSENLFSDFFFRKHEIPLPGYSSFEQLNR